jgi:RimJ/RimL family protein N-acetyltransferase
MRRAVPGDLTAIHAIMSDPEAMRFWSTPAHADLAETQSWFASMLAADEAEESDEFVIERDQIVIGKIGAWRFPEIGFFLRRDCWRRGFATEGLQGYIGYAKERGLERLTADVDPRNGACLRLLGKCGFVETGSAKATYVVGGRPCDSVYLELGLQAHLSGGNVR